MKIDIDLSEIFDGDDENVQDSVKDTIIGAVVEKIYRNIDQQMRDKVRDILEKAITDRLTAYLDALIPELMDYEFTETTRYGEAKGTITVKNRILKDIEKEMVWKDGSYDSDKSIYTKVMKKVIEAKLTEFAKQFVKDIDSRFVSECIGYVQKDLQKRMGIEP